MNSLSEEKSMLKKIEKLETALPLVEPYKKACQELKDFIYASKDKKRSMGKCFGIYKE